LPTHKATARSSVDNWTGQLNDLFDRIANSASLSGWSSTRDRTEIREDPFSLGAPIMYEAPVLTLRRPDPQSGAEDRITFEPRHRYAIGAAGRIDVYSYPRLRDAMLLRILDTGNAENLTWEEAGDQVADAPWRAFSLERLPLSVDLANDHSLAAFLEDMVA
jgi:hypothetical protein